LAGTAGVSPSLASSHLRKLVEGGLLVVEPVGRQRLLLLAPPASVHPRPALHGLERATQTISQEAWAPR
jgi:DNA-binding transcriptional ArsR family regulator